MNEPTEKAAVQLAACESGNSRLFYLRISPSQQESAIQHGYFDLSRSVEERSCWETFRKNDLLISYALTQKLRTGCLKVTGKAICSRFVDRPSVKEPFRVLVEPIATQEHRTLSGDLFFSKGTLSVASRNGFRQLWESATKLGGQTPNHPEQTPLYEHDGLQVNVAESAEDFAFISDVAAFHPFGLRTAFLTLIAVEGGQRVAALLADYSNDGGRSHRQQWRLFREQYNWIRDRAITIHRIYSPPNRWRAHRALINTVLKVAPELIDDQLSLVDGVSYDYHPVAHRAGFNVEVPRRVEGSFYYWHPFSLPRTENGDVIRRSSTVNSEAVKAVLSERGTVRYWIVEAPSQHVSTAIEMCAWALRKKGRNTGIWHNLTEGNIVFLKNDKAEIVAYGRVVGREMRRVDGFRSFPLWIDFQSPMIFGVLVSIREHIHESWFLDSIGGGISPLPDEFGANLKLQCDEQSNEGKMWVEPNPYLLRGTDFDVRPNQVFVVLAWSLKDTVYPVVRDILASEGYTAVFAGDRDGQVIFEDIWLMLNEAEAVIVDFTNKRPNVYLEYGMALVLGKPIVAITQSPDDIPSDTPNLKYIVYSDSLGDRTLPEQLPRALRDTISDIRRTKANSGVTMP